jgi:hypothetical protein
MFISLQVLTVMVVAVAMALALAHALELPGKMRLSKEQYLAVQPIYYPGFTFGGMAEPIGMILLLVLLFLTPFGSAPFWLTAGALVALLAMHATYWLLTHPVNNFWLEDFKLERAGASFFSFDPLGRIADGEAVDWTRLRDRWERSHLIRTGFGVLSFVLLVSAVAL